MDKFCRPGIIGSLAPNLSRSSEMRCLTRKSAAGSPCYVAVKVGVVDGDWIQLTFQGFVPMPVTCTKPREASVSKETVQGISPDELGEEPEKASST